MRQQPGGERNRRSRWIGRCGALAAALLNAASAGAVECIGPAAPVPDVCGRKLKPPYISCSIPTDAQPERPFYLIQRATNVFSWQAFIGLQWPASKTERGQPDPTAPIGAPGPTVWETWREGNEVFRPDGEPPLAWNAPSPIPAKCAGSDRVLFRTSKVDNLLSDVAQPTGATAGRPLTLKDQKSELTRYEIRINRTAYDAITKNEWWNGARQANLGSVNFPDNSMIVKAAWIPIADGDATHFRAIDACVCDSADSQESECAVKKMGLVGFHLMSKTPSAPQWFWSTFEQEDNAPGACPGPTSRRIPPYTYWNPAQGQRDVNQQTKERTPNQICRLYPISDNDPNCLNPYDATDNVQALNESVQGALAKTPFTHYQLVNTQWPVAGSSPVGGPHTQFDVLPQILGNTTLESFIQGTSSCMGCHAMARTRRNVSPSKPDGQAFFSSDFTFTLGLAQPAPAPPPLLRALSSRDCPEGNSDPKCLGLRIATDTYNQLPQNVGAKLHCTSCHLDEGRNPRASWWQNVVAKWSTKPGGIAGRINSCFTNSLNGKALCTPDKQGLCPDNSSMSGLIAYMSWLALPDNNPENIPTERRHAFPPVAAGNGVATQGAKIFLQKCAFCHGAGGEGRYEDNTYFRPALWGANSFNTSAGMDSTADLAPFIHGNMPFHSGGELSQQEVRDLACFIDSKPRPMGPKPHNPSDVSDITCGQFEERPESRSPQP
jgi:cytochrome c